MTNGNIESVTADMQAYPDKARARIGLAAAGSILSLSTILMACADESSEPTARSAAIEEITTSSTPEEIECATTWEIETADHGDNNRWFGDGVKVIGEAHAAPAGEQKEKAEDAAYTWFDQVKRDPQLFAGTLSFFNDAQGLDEAKGVTAADLIDENDPACASEKAVALATQFEAFIGSADVNVGTAPADGVNSGTDAEGNVTQAEDQGVYGSDEERKAISFSYTREDGTKCVKWVMERCGQIVVTVDCAPPTSEVPKGPTEKFDDGIVPGPIDEPGEPDVAGEGPAGQTPGDDGYLPGENRPDNPDSPDTTTTTTTRTGETTPTTTPDDEQPEGDPTPVTTSTSVPNDTIPPRPQ